MEMEHQPRADVVPNYQLGFNTIHHDNQIIIKGSIVTRSVEGRRKPPTEERAYTESESDTSHPCPMSLT